MFEARLAKVHLRVDDARQDMQAGGINDFAGTCGGERADGDDLAVFDAYIAWSDAIVVHERSALDENIVGLRHHGFFRLWKRRFS